MFARVSGLNNLVEHYPVTEVPEEVGLLKQTVMIGIVRYRACVAVGVDTKGLYLDVNPILSKSIKLLIPWGEIKQTCKSKLYGRRAVCLSIGDPKIGKITVYDGLFASMKEYLR